ncbi:serine/threonine-protein kinase [Myxococcaceae bacterium GXIMD 01537]
MRDVKRPARPRVPSARTPKLADSEVLAEQRSKDLALGMKALDFELAKHSFEEGAIRYSFVKTLETRGHGVELALFERRLEHGVSGPVVVKRLTNPRSFILSRRLAEEVQLAFRLHHPAIAQVLSMPLLGDVPHVVMEYVEGPSLETLHTAAALRREPLSVPFALFLAAEVADALHHAHTLRDRSEGGRPLGIIHRDVSPRNIRVDRSTGAVKLTDFGAAFSLIVGREESPEQLVKGDLIYASPEYLHGAPLDARSDLFSLGLVLLETLTSRHLLTLTNLPAKPVTPPPEPHPAARAEESGAYTLKEVLALMDSCTSEDVARETQGLPDGVRALVHRLLQRAPSERFASAEELLQALRAQLGALAPGYGRREAALEVAAVLSAASAARGLGVPAERDVFPEHLDAHELLPEG